MKTAIAAGLLGLALLAPGGASAQSPLELRVRPEREPFTTGSVRRLSPDNPNVTRSNRLGVVGWDGPPGDVPSVIGDSEPLPPGSPALTQNGLYGR